LEERIHIQRNGFAPVIGDRYFLNGELRAVHLKRAAHLHVAVRLKAIRHQIGIRRRNHGRRVHLPAKVAHRAVHLERHRQVARLRRLEDQPAMPPEEAKLIALIGRERRALEWGRVRRVERIAGGGRKIGEKRLSRHRRHPDENEQTKANRSSQNSFHTILVA
jgi:hypothetical protein